MLSFAPTRRLALAIALAAPFWLLSGSGVGVGVAIAVTALVLAAVVADVVRAPTRDAVAVERRLPESVGLGDRVEGEYLLHSSWPRALALRLYDRLPAGLTRVTEDGRPVTLEALGEATLPFVVEGRERGSWEPGPVALRVAGTLGLVDRLVRTDPGGTITVAPSVAGVRRYRLLALQRRLRDAGVRQLRRRGEGTSFASLREYAVGDDPRHMDWKATARRGKPIVREYTVEQGQTMIIAVDAGRLMTQLADGVPRFEHALSAATVLADIAVHSGDQVGLLLFDDEVRAWVPPSRGRPALERLRAALVPARATMSESDYAAAFRTLATRHRKRALVVLFTDAVDVHASQALVAHTARGASRHLPLVVALRNDALVSAATPVADASTESLYQAAAAEELLQAREEALQRMRQAGVSVVDVSPRSLAAAVVNRYLEIKGRGAL
ncbi:MAG TPA: DUF58 domain-containing protein [Gemmatimonadales bacterium]